MQATGENYTPDVEEAVLLENRNVELVYDVRNTEQESIGQVRMEIARTANPSMAIAWCKGQRYDSQ